MLLVQWYLFFVLFRCKIDSRPGRCGETDVFLNVSVDQLADKINLTIAKSHTLVSVGN